MKLSSRKLMVLISVAMVSTLAVISIISVNKKSALLEMFPVQIATPICSGIQAHAQDQFASRWQQYCI
jgi:hypothetical protein